MNDRLSSETVHATCVAKDGQAVLILGPSGAGKSDLALRMIDRDFDLVSDDQTILRKERGQLIARAPATIAGKFEVRGLGIVDFAPLAEARVILAVELAREIERMPDEKRARPFLGIAVPLVSIDPQTASAAIKVDLAMTHFGGMGAA